MKKFSIHSLGKLISNKSMEKYYIKIRTRRDGISETRSAKKRLKLIGGGYNGSNKEFKDTVLPYWKKYGQKPDKLWYDLFCNGKDAYDPRYVPDSMWYTQIIPYFNYYVMGKAYADKAMYSRLLPNVRKPETIVKNIAGHFYNGDRDELITRAEAERLCSQEEHLIIKPSVLSGRGKDVTFFDRDRKDSEQIAQIFDRFEANFVVQRLVRQHADLARINASSLNTIRVVSFHFKGEVHILSTILRMGGTGARVDNISAGGICCVIKPDGWLAERAVTRKSQWTDAHPSGIKFRDVRVPNFEGVIETAKRLHRQLPYFSIIGWDFGVAENGDPVFIEFNVMPEPNQISCGPTFGDLSDEVFEEVFLKKSMKHAFNNYN